MKKWYLIYKHILLVSSVYILKITWLAPSKQLVKVQEVRVPENNCLLRSPVRMLRPQVESRSPINIDQGQWLSGKSGATRNRRNCSSGNCHSNVLFVKLLRTAKLIFVSKVLPLEHSRKPAKPTWLEFLRMPTI